MFIFINIINTSVSPTDVSLLTSREANRGTYICDNHCSKAVLKLAEMSTS